MGKAPRPLLNIDKHSTIELFAFLLLWCTVFVSLIVVYSNGPRLEILNQLEQNYCQNLLDAGGAVQPGTDNAHFAWGTYNCVSCHYFSQQGEQNSAGSRNSVGNSYGGSSKNNNNDDDDDEKASHAKPVTKFSLRFVAYLKQSGRPFEGHDFTAYYSQITHISQEDARACNKLGALSSYDAYPAISGTGSDALSTARVQYNYTQVKVQFTCNKENANKVCESQYLNSADARDVESVAVLFRLDLQDFMDDIANVRVEYVYQNALFADAQKPVNALFVAVSVLFAAFGIWRTSGVCAYALRVHDWLILLLVSQLFYNDWASVALPKTYLDAQAWPLLAQVRIVAAQAFPGVVLLFWLDAVNYSRKSSLFEEFKTVSFYLKIGLVAAYVVPSAMQQALVAGHLQQEAAFDDNAQREYEKLYAFRYSALFAYGVVYAFYVQYYCRTRAPKRDARLSAPPAQMAPRRRHLPADTGNKGRSANSSGGGRNAAGSASTIGRDAAFQDNQYDEEDEDSDSFDEEEMQKLVVNGNNTLLVTVSVVNYVLFLAFCLRTESKAEDLSIVSLYGAPSLLNLYGYAVTYFYAPRHRKRARSKTNDDVIDDEFGARRGVSDRQYAGRDFSAGNDNGESFRFDGPDQEYAERVQNQSPLRQGRASGGGEIELQGVSAQRKRQLRARGGAENELRLEDDNGEQEGQPDDEIRPRAQQGDAGDDGDNNGDFNEDLMADISDDENQQKHRSTTEAARAADEHRRQHPGYSTDSDKEDYGDD